MKKASKEAHGKDIKAKICSIRNILLTNHEVSTHETIKRVLSLPMRHSNVDFLYDPTGLKKNRTRMLKSSLILEKKHPDDIIVFASDISDKYENGPNNLQSIFLADIASSNISKKADALPVEPDEIKIYTVPVSNINDVKLHTNIIVLKNELSEMQKCS